MNNTFYAPNDYRVYLAHHGIKGQKWGVRRFQNADGSYTSAGKGRYGIGDGKSYNGVKASKGIVDRASAIKSYRSSYNKASSMRDAADAKWRETMDARKQMGRTAIGRTVAAIRNNTDAAKNYSKKYDEWNRMQEAADAQWRDAKDKYKATGSNKISRVINNAKYDIDSAKAKRLIEVGRGAIKRRR